MKNNDLKELLLDMGKCECCTKLDDKSLINFYNSDMAENIPSIWTDWINRLDSEIMIVGQDWGPYDDMKKLYERYKNGEDWNKLIAEEKSLTKRNLEKFFKLTNPNYDIKSVYVTNAIMCARNGSNYRGDNIKLKYSILKCSSFLERQIDIVKPKIILTLGYYPLLSLSSIFDFKIDSSLTKVIDNTPVIKIHDFVIIPAFHPAAQISLDKQIKQYELIWKYL